MKSARSPRRLLVVNYHYPPMPSVGGNRWSATVPYLRELGWEVTVMATGAHGRLAGEEERHVERVADLGQNQLLRRLLRRPPLTSPSVDANATRVPDQPAPAVLTKALVPDAYVVSWVPAAARAARRLVRQRRFDCVVTSSPFESIHLVGLAARPLTAWVADLRDPWGVESMRPPFPTRLQQRLDDALERRCLTSADAVTAAHRATVEDLDRRLGVRAHWIPNAWDPRLADTAAAPPPALSPRRPGVTRLVHTGRFASEPGRNPRSFVAVVSALLERDPGLAQRLEIVLAGSMQAAERPMWEPLRRAGVLVELGPLPRPQALGVQQTADVLLLFAAARSAALPYKLLEYFGAQRPVLALASGTEAGKVVRATGTGTVVALDDTAGIERALLATLDGRLPYGPRTEELARYRFPSAAAAMATALEEAIRRRALQAREA